MSAPDDAPRSALKTPLALGAVTHVAHSSREHDCTLTRHSSANGFDLGPAEGREVVHDGDADLDFSGLAIGISSHDPLTQELYAVHHCLDSTSDVVAGPCLPERSAQAPGCPQDLVSRGSSRTVFFPGAAITADRYDGSCPPDGTWACRRSRAELAMTIRELAAIATAAASGGTAPNTARPRPSRL